MFCSNCGKKLETDSNFCEHCGNRIESDTNEVTPIKEDESIPNTETNQQDSKKPEYKLLFMMISIVSVILLLGFLWFYSSMNHDRTSKQGVSSNDWVKYNMDYDVYKNTINGG